MGYGLEWVWRKEAKVSDELYDDMMTDDIDFDVMAYNRAHFPRNQAEWEKALDALDIACAGEAKEKAENARLRSALRALVEHPFSGVSMAQTAKWECAYCRYEGERHISDCPIMAGRKLLEGE